MFGLAVDIAMLAQQSAHAGVAQQDARLLRKVVAQLVDRPHRKSIAQRPGVSSKRTRECIQIGVISFGGTTTLGLIDESS